MSVDVNDATHPLDNNLVDPASAGAAELRAIKDKINKLYSSLGVDATWPKLIDTARGFNFDISDSSITDLQTSKFRITRAANASGKNTWGFVAESVLANNVNVGSGFVGGMTAFATIGTGCTFGIAYAMSVGVTQQTHNSVGQVVGLGLQFSNRTSVGLAAPGGLGSNQYNINAYGIFIDAMPRSSSGEYCGWKVGIKFGANSMDRDVTSAGYCIDLSAVNPSKILAGIKLASLVGIIWDIGDSIISYYDGVTGLMHIRVGGINKWSLDTATGNVYKNGVLAY